MTEQRNDEFPDQIYFNHVRDALWRRPSQASVMIGSGFSRHARKNRPDASEIPLWRDLTDALAKDLSASRDEPMAEAAALELAQEYERAFGRARLHQFLIESVRDEDFSPGEFHERLLRLPWRDLYTTNWDTLLERCPPHERAYSLVTSADHLPLGAPPRIVKLHGSLPGTFPLIVTKDDYEKVPEKYAPFVNTVRQAMMETVLLLLGFSGEDPNFLQWLSWVRANLRENAPRIYLAGWQDLDESSRQELMKENVLPINLRQHPKAADWPEPLRHAKALEWVLLSLEHGQPYPPEDWPSHVGPKRPGVPKDLKPVDRVRVRHPKEEPWEKPQGEPHEPAYLEEIRALLPVWKHNRQCYPSWLVMPSDAAHEMRQKTDNWQPPILTALPNLADGVERLSALSELVWRREAVLDPLFKDLEEAVAGVLEEIDCERRLVGGEKLGDLDWGPVRRQWRTLTAALMTEARINFHHERFEQWIEQSAPFMAEDQDLVERVQHEKCLWELNQQDYARLQDLVEHWEPRAADPAWLLRKAALLAELGRSDEASALALGVLEAVRRWSADPGSLAGRSREAWALQLSYLTSGDRENSFSRVRGLESRYRELAQYGCDPTAELRAHERAVVGSPPAEKQRPFDLGRTTGEGLSFSNVAQYRALAAMRAIRFVEVVGSPNAYSGELLSRAAEALLPDSPEWAAVLAVRCAGGGADRRFSRTLSRWRIASMEPELARNLAESQRRTIEHALEQMERSTSAVQTWWVWSQRLEAAMEALSRFVLRLKPEEVESVLQLARDLYCDPRIHSRIQYCNALAHLLQRSWEALPGSLQAQHALDLLRLPIVGVDGFNVDLENHFRDPGCILDAANLVRDCPAPARLEANESAWVEVVRLLVKGLSSGDTARKRASARLAVLSRWQGLTPDERQRLARALWDFGLDCDGLPRDADLHPWVFLTLPEPEPGLAESRLRAAWVRSSSWEEESRESLEKVLADAGAALERIPEFGHEIEFTSTEVDSLRAAVDRWATMGPRRILPWESGEVPQWHRTLRNISTLLLELDVSSGAAQTLLESVRKLGTGRTPAFELLPGIVKADQELADAVTSLLRVGLGGSTPEQREQALSACVGLFLWLRAFAREDSGLLRPPDDLIFEIGVMISVPRWPVLSQALEIAAWVFEEGNTEHRELLRSSVLTGLGFLRRALVFQEISPHPFVEQPQVREDEVDVPLIRWRCVQLAKAMDSAGRGEEVAIAGWLEDAENDPLPEVRFAVEGLRDRGVSESGPDPE